MTMMMMAGAGGAMGERDRGARGDAGAASSLWIDYVLLPEKLEEHLTALAAGHVASPTPADLIAMFLEQALLSQKALEQAVLSPPPSAMTMVGKTAALLCERAARVAVAAGLSLLEIQASISSHQHQFMLLKALVKHDKCRLLIHECNLHRWILRNALRSHPLGSAAPNAASPGPRAVVWALGEDLTDPLKITDNGGALGVPNGGTGNYGAGDPSLEEERPSVDFLENVLMHEDGPCLEESALSNGRGEVENMTAQEKEDQLCSNQSLGKEGPASTFMSKEYRCQVMLDVAEVHFMRGRIHRAHELFTSCGDLVKSEQHNNETDRTPSDGVIPELRKINSSKAGRLEPAVPTERLAGFIVACRMLLGTHAKSSAMEERQQSLKGIGLDKSPVLGLGIPSAAHRMVIACEQSRYIAKQASKTSQTLVHRTPAEDHLSTEPPKKKLKLSPGEQKPQDGEQTTGVEAHRGASRELEISEDDHGMSHNTFVAYVSNGTEYEGKEQKSGIFGLEPAGHGAGVTIEARRTAGEGNNWLSTVEPIILSKENLQREINSLEAEGEYDGRQLVQIVVNDTLKGYLQWGYRVSLARDPDIPVSIHCQLIACNVVRHIVERAPIQSFLEASDALQNNIGGVEFLMSLMAAVKENFDGMAEGKYNSTLVDIQISRMAQNGQGRKGKSRNGNNITAFKALSSHICDSARYICCVLDKPWCWKAAVKNRLISCTVVPKISVPETPISITSELLTSTSLVSAKRSKIESTTEDIAAEIQGDVEELNEASCQIGDSKGDQTMKELNLKAHIKLEAILCALLRAEDVGEIERLVLESNRLYQNLSRGGNEPWKAVLICSDHGSGDSKLNHMRMSRTGINRWATFPNDVAALLRRRAFNALDCMKQLKVARRLYELARMIHPKDNDSMVMLWLLDKVTPEHGLVTRPLGLEEVDREVLPDLGSIEYIVIALLEKELWNDLSEFCQWGLTRVKEGKSTEVDGITEGAGKGRAIGVHFQHKRFAQTLKVATILGELMQLCSALLSATGRNHYTEDVALMSTTVSQLFEDFLLLLVGADVEGHSKGAEDGNQLWGTQSSQVAPPPGYPGAKAVPLIAQITNPRVLMSLASLMAGWLQRCNIAGLTPWPLSIERYGGLAAVTSGASLPPPAGSLPHAANLFRPLPPKVAPEFGQDLFGMLLECIVGLPGVVEGDKEKGHRWLQGLADLAFEDEAYVKALQLYLQAGGIRSAYYCDRSSAMPRDIFTPWVLRRMVQGCRAIGASVQAAVLCQCLPAPDHESAFRILQENSLIVVRDAVAYFDCVWEVPILELLVHMHSKNGDEDRVSALISLLQQPALNVHNPQSIRLAHVASLEQRFLQRLCGELL